MNYFESIQANFLAPCTVSKNLVVPRYFKFLFQLIIQGEKSYICEHDLFVFTQELENMAPQKQDKSKVKPSKLDGFHDIIESDLVMDLTGKKRVYKESMFTQAFVNDCILITREINKKPKRPKHKFCMMNMHTHYATNIPQQTEMNRT